MIAGPKGISGIYGYPKTAHLQAESLKQCPPDPSMPDQDQLNDFLEALEELGSPAKNPVLRVALGWDEPLYEEVKAELVAKGIVVRGRGRSDSVSLVGAEPVVQQATQANPPAMGKLPPTAQPRTNPSNPGSGTRPVRSAAPGTRRNTRTTSCR